MIVTDHATGVIFIYDISGPTAVELGQIVTGKPGIMGVKFGPDGKIWYVNATTNEVVRLEFNDITGTNEKNNINAISVHPNPSNTGTLTLNTNVNGNYLVNILNSTGQILSTHTFDGSIEVLDISNLTAGQYFIQVIDSNDGSVSNEKFIVLK